MSAAGNRPDQPRAGRLPRLLLAVAAFSIHGTAAAQSTATPRLEVEIEGGPTWQARNDIEIPNDGSATRFSLGDLVGAGPVPAARISLTWNASERHGLRILAAPLSYTKTGVPDQPLRFAGRSYEPGRATEATYQFNSWRASYRYRFKQGDRWSWWVGGTLKVRDAKVRLRQDSVASQDTDLGLVPLLHLSGERRLAERWNLRLDLDALAGGPGRAVDLSLALRYQLGERWQVGLGYRLLEGGADVESVYNFAWFNYLTVSASYALP
jgi:hypothetical protein